MNDLKRKNCDEMKKKSYFLSIGRLTKQKNHIFLINFFSKNHSYLKNHELIITGEGKLESTCRRIIDDKKLNDKIKIKDISDNVNIKITDIEGNLVAEAESRTNLRYRGYNLEIDGGTAYWNGKNLGNNQVASGVYLIMLSDLDTFETKVLKLMVIR